MYTPENLDKIKQEFDLLSSKKNQLHRSILELEQKLKVNKSKEYLLHGALRRIGTITRCMENIFSIFPPSQNSILGSQKIEDVTINLHAFFINVSGILDNLALVFYYEKKLDIKRNDVCFFKKDFQKKLGQNLKEYLTDQIKEWYCEYSKNYRDALCHRIPFYVPPYQQDPSTLEKSPCFAIRHSLVNDEEDKNRPVAFHAQVIADFNTVEALIDKFCTHFDE